MNVAVVQGRAVAPAEPRELGSGSTVWSFDVATTSDEGRSVSVPVCWTDPPRPPSFEAGAAVLVLGSVRRRFFRSGGATVSRTELVAERVVVGAARRARAALAAEAVQRVGSAGDLPG